MAKEQTKRSGVPRGEDNPIEYLLARGWSESKLAAEWELTDSSSVRKLRRFNHVPRYRTAIYMAKTFGWASAGEVMDFFAARTR